MKTFFSFLLVILPLLSQAQRLGHEHTDFFGGPVGNTYLSLKLPDSNKGFILTGYTTDTSNSGIVPPNPTGLGQLFVRFDSAGRQKKIWLVPTVEGAGRMIQTPDGNVVCQSIDYTTNWAGDILIYKMNSLTGNILWRKTYGSSQQENVWDMIPTADGGFLIAGSSRGADGDIPSNHTPAGGFPPADYVLIKTDSLGNKQWLKVLGTSGDDDHFVDLYAIGNAYYFITETIPKDYEFADTARYPLSKGMKHSCLVKLDTSGNILFSRTIAPGRHYNSLFDAIDSSFVIAGAIWGNAAYPPFSQGSIQGSADVTLVKTDLEGNVIWAKVMGFPSEEGGKYVVTIPSQVGYIVSADRGGTDGVVSPITTNYEIELFEVDLQGNLVDTFRLGGPDTDYSQNLFTHLGKVYVVGKTSSPWFFPPVQAVRPYNTVKSTTSVSRFGLWPMGTRDTGDTLKKSSLRAWPNPTKGTLHVGIPGSSGTLIMLNTKGQEVGRWQIISNQTELSTTGLPSGVYLLQWQNPKGPLQTVKIVVQ